MWANKIDRIQHLHCIVEVFVEFLSMMHSFCNKQTLLFVANFFDNQKRSIISAHVLIIETSEINTFVKGIVREYIKVFYYTF